MHLARAEILRCVQREIGHGPSAVVVHFDEGGVHLDWVRVLGGGHGWIGAAKTKGCQIAERMDGRMNIREDGQDAIRDTRYTIHDTWYMEGGTNGTHLVLSQILLRDLGGLLKFSGPGGCGGTRRRECMCGTSGDATFEGALFSHGIVLR